MIDHGTGIVIGETCVIGRNCSLLHGVTLGGTGNTSSFDRHPKIGNNVFIGCQATILGDINIGDDATIGSGSLVLKPIPPRAVAVGSPAIIKRFKQPALEVYELKNDEERKEEGVENSVVTLWEHEEKWSPKSWKILPNCCSEVFSTIHAADDTYHGNFDMNMKTHKSAEGIVDRRLNSSGNLLHLEASESREGEGFSCVIC